MTNIPFEEPLHEELAPVRKTRALSDTYHPADIYPESYSHDPYYNPSRKCDSNQRNNYDGSNARRERIYGSQNHTATEELPLTHSRHVYEENNPENQPWQPGAMTYEKKRHHSSCPTSINQVSHQLYPMQTQKQSYVPPQVYQHTSNENNRNGAFPIPVQNSQNYYSTERPPMGRTVSESHITNKLPRPIPQFSHIPMSNYTYGHPQAAGDSVEPHYSPQVITPGYILESQQPPPIFPHQNLDGQQVGPSGFAPVTESGKVSLPSYLLQPSPKTNKKQNTQKNDLKQSLYCNIKEHHDLEDHFHDLKHKLKNKRYNEKYKSNDSLELDRIDKIIERQTRTLEALDLAINRRKNVFQSSEELFCLDEEITAKRAELSRAKRLLEKTHQELHDVAQHSKNMRICNSYDNVNRPQPLEQVKKNLESVVKEVNELLLEKDVEFQNISDEIKRAEDQFVLKK